MVAVICVLPSAVLARCRGHYHVLYIIVDREVNSRLVHLDLLAAAQHR